MMLSMLSLFAQMDGGDAGAAAAAGFGLFSFVIFFGLLIVLVAAQWKVFTKAGKPGWASIIPIYNLIVLLEIVGKPIWWILLVLIPCVGQVVLIILSLELAKSFGQGIGFGIGLVLLPIVFLPILAFGSSRYQPVA